MTLTPKNKYSVRFFSCWLVLMVLFITLLHPVRVTLVKLSMTSHESLQTELLLIAVHRITSYSIARKVETETLGRGLMQDTSKD